MRQFLRSCMLVTLVFSFATATAAAQGGMLAGKVINRSTGEPIPNAIVVLENPEANPPRLEQQTDDALDLTAAKSTRTRTMEVLKKITPY